MNKVSNFYIKSGSELSEPYWNSKQKGKSVILVQIVILQLRSGERGVLVQELRS